MLLWWIEIWNGTILRRVSVRVSESESRSYFLPMWPGVTRSGQGRRRRVRDIVMTFRVQWHDTPSLLRRKSVHGPQATRMSGMAAGSLATKTKEKKTPPLSTSSYTDQIRRRGRWSGWWTCWPPWVCHLDRQQWHQYLDRVPARQFFVIILWKYTSLFFNWKKPNCIWNDFNKFLLFLSSITSHSLILLREQCGHEHYISPWWMMFWLY